MDRTIDLNADMGESFGLYRYGADEELIGHISSANLACGFHGGDPSVMRASVRLALQHGVSVGAHVGFPDLLGFGRRYMHVKADHLRDYVTYQLGALSAFARAEGIQLQHLKPHGALYMMALEDDALAGAIVEAMARFDAKLMLYTIADSAADRAAGKKGIRVVPEFFADRGYFADGRVKMFDWKLEEAGTSPADIGRRVARLVTDGVVHTIDGGVIRPIAQTICVHSDTPGAPDIAAAITHALGRAGIALRSPQAI